MNAHDRRALNNSERDIIAEILVDDTRLVGIADILKPEHFSNKEYGRLYGVCREIFNEGKRLSLQAIETRFGPSYGEDEQDTRLLLTSLHREGEKADGSFTHEHAEKIIDRWRRAVMLERMDRAKKDLDKPGSYSDDVLSDLIASMQDIGAESSAAPIKTMGELFRGVVERSKTTKASRIVPGLSFGLPSLDEIMGRMHPGDFGVIGARQGDGKGQPLDALVLTPFGYRKMGDLKIGSLVTTKEGGASSVIGIYPLGLRQLYRVSFSDGTSTEVTDDHIWLATSIGRRRYRNGAPDVGDDRFKLFTTSGIMKILEKSPKKKFHIPVADPVQFTRAGGYEHCPIPPYTFGALLGDGSFRNNRIGFYSADGEIVCRIESELSAKLLKQASGNCGKASSYLVPARTGVREKLSAMGLMELKSEEKFIPKRYLLTDASKRRDLLHGLMDTDGWVNVNGDPHFGTKSKRLADDVAWLARSLGAVVKIREKQSSYVSNGRKIDCGIAFDLRLKFKDGADAFGLRRKKLRCNKPQFLVRTITSIDPSRVAEAQCIKVSDPSSLYLTNDFIVTHNTIVGAQIAMHVAETSPVVYFQLEMQGDDMAARAGAGITNISVDEIEEGAPDFEAYTRLEEAQERLASLALYVDARPRLRLDQIRDRCVSLKRSRGLGLAVIDHLRLIRCTQKFNNKFDRAEFVTGELKAMAKDLQIAVIVLSQVTRASQRRDDPFPQLTDFDSGSSVEQDADWAMALFRRDQWLKLNKPLDMSEGNREADKWLDDYKACKGQIEIGNLKRRRGEASGRRSFTFLGRQYKIAEL